MYDIDNWYWNWNLILIFEMMLDMMLQLMLIWCWFERYDDARSWTTKDNVNYNSYEPVIAKKCQDAWFWTLWLRRSEWPTPDLIVLILNCNGITSWTLQSPKNQGNNTTKPIVTKTDTIYKIKRIPDWYESDMPQVIIDLIWFSPSDEDFWWIGN